MLQKLTTAIRTDRNLSDMLRHSGVMYAFGTISTVLIVIQQITTASLIGAADYGRLATVLGSGAFIMLIMDVRTWEIGTKLLVRPINDKQHRQINQIINWLTLVDLMTGFLSALIVFALAPFIARDLLRAPELMWLVQLYALSNPFRMFSNGMARTVLRMYDYFNWLAWKSVIYGGSRLCFMTGAALIGLGLQGVIIGAILSEIIGALALMMMAWLVRRRETSDVSLWDFTRPQQFGEGMKLIPGLWLSGTLAGLQIEMFIPLLALLTTPEQVGLFRSGLDIGETIEKLLTPFAVVLWGQVMRTYEQNTRSALLQLVRQSSLLMGLLTLPFLIGIILIGPILLPRILGTGFESVALIASLISSGFTVYGILMWTRPALIALNRIQEINWIGVATVLVSTIALLIIAPLYGAIGGAVVRSGSLVAQNVFQLLVFRTRLSPSPS